MSEYRVGYHRGREDAYREMLSFALLQQSLVHRAYRHEEALRRVIVRLNNEKSGWSKAVDQDEAER